MFENTCFLASIVAAARIVVGHDSFSELFGLNNLPCRQKRMSLLFQQPYPQHAGKPPIFVQGTTFGGAGSRTHKAKEVAQPS